MTSFLPWDKQWFLDDLEEVDYRTTHRSIKNDSKSFRPTWLPDGSTIRDEIVKLIASRLETEPIPAPPAVQAPPTDGDDSSDDEFGPNFGAIVNLPGSGANEGGSSALTRVSNAINAYERHAKGYVPTSCVLSQ